MCAHSYPSSTINNQQSNIYQSKEYILNEGDKDTKFVRRKRMSWDDFFMQMAITVSERTACLFHKAGSVFVDDNHRIVSVGYNGPSSGDYHCVEVGCAKVHGDPITGEMKRCRGAHGEINAIINSGDTGRLRESTLYITLFPCYDCMKALNNVGVKRIVYLDEYLRIIDGTNGEKKESEKEAWELAKKRGIVIDKYESQQIQKSKIKSQNNNDKNTDKSRRNTENKKSETDSRW